jgi:hypothetical protein
MTWGHFQLYDIHNKFNVKLTFVSDLLEKTQAYRNTHACTHILFLEIVTVLLGILGSCEHDNEPSGPIEGGEFLDYLSSYQPLKKDTAPWS